MIEKLSKIYDEEMFNCIYKRGRRSDSCNSFGNLSQPLIKIAEKFVCNCCNILNINKNTNITATFEGYMFVPSSISFWVYFSIDFPENHSAIYKDICKNEVVLKSYRLIKFEMPRFSSNFNNDSLAFYKDLMSKIYDKYKAIKFAIKDIKEV